MFSRTPAPPATTVGNRVAYQNPAEVTARRLLCGLQSGLPYMVEWALSALLAKSLHGEVLLEHAPGLAPALVDAAAAAILGPDGGGDVAALRTALGDPRATRKGRVLTVLCNLAAVPHNAAEMASTRAVAEFLFGEIGSRNDDDDDDDWRLALDALGALAPFMLLAAGRGPWVAMLFGLLALRDDADASGGALRVLSALSSSAANGMHFAATPESCCARVAELSVHAPPQLHDAAARLLHNLASFSPLACSVAVRCPGVVRMLFATLALSAEVASTASTSTADSRALSQCIDRGRVAAQTLRLLARAAAAAATGTADDQSTAQLFEAFEPFLVTLAASDNALAASASTVLQQLCCAKLS